MVGETAQRGCPIGGKGESGDDAADDCHEGVTVEITERCESVAATAKVRGFGQGHFHAMPGFPELAGRLVAVARGFVERAFRQAELAVGLDDDPPGKRFEPDSLHDWPPSGLDFRARRISSTVSLS